MYYPGPPTIIFRRYPTDDMQEKYLGSFQDPDELQIWVTEKCVPLIREINYNTCRELAEEELPFLTLYHKAGDERSIKRFTNAIERELADERRKFALS